MKTKMKLLGLAAVSVLAFSAQADDIPYTYGELSYQSVDFDGDDGDGFALAGSYDFGNQFYGFGEYDTTELDNSNVDVSGFQLGVGYQYPISPGTDLVGELAFVSADIDSGAGGADDTGYSLAFGMRSMVNPQVELFGKAEYVSVFDDGDTGFEFGGFYYLGNGLGFGASYENVDDIDGFKLTGRYTF